MNKALSPMAMFDEIMMNQTKILIQPSVSLKSVSAKLVFDHIAAMSEKVPAKFIILSISKKYGYLSKGKSQM